MAPLVNTGSLLWQYLSPDQRVLLGDGEFLLEDSTVHKDEEPTDYSYIVFPFAKMYEGFLKQLFLDTDIISTHEYESDHFRIGKALSPNLAGRLGRKSAFLQVERRYGKDLATRLWHTWKQARNLVFHYFPHNYRALSKDQAVMLIHLIIDTMNDAITVTHVRPRIHED